MEEVKDMGAGRKKLLLLMLTFCLEDEASEENGGKKEAWRLWTDNIRELIFVVCGFMWGGRR